MSKEKSNANKKIAEGKKASHAANKKAKTIKVNKEAKKLAEKTVMEMASNMPAGEGNAFISLFHKYLKAVENVRAANKNKSNVRSELKGIKVDMSCFDRVFKLYEMDPADVQAKKTTEALYEKQLSMALSPDQKKVITDIETKRESNRAQMSELASGETGKEVGSATDDTVDNDPAKVPERNDAIGTGFRAPATPVAASVPVAGTTALAAASITH